MQWETIEQVFMHDHWITYRSQLWIHALLVRGTRNVSVFTWFVLLLFLRSLLGLEASTKTQKSAQRKKLGQQCDLDCAFELLKGLIWWNANVTLMGSEYNWDFCRVADNSHHPNDVGSRSSHCLQNFRHLSKFLACVAQMLLTHWGSCKRNSNKLNQKRSRKLQRPKMPRSLRSARSFGGATSIPQEILNMVLKWIHSCCKGS